MFKKRSGPNVARNLVELLTARRRSLAIVGALVAMTLLSSACITGANAGGRLQVTIVSTNGQAVGWYQMAATGGNLGYCGLITSGPDTGDFNCIGGASLVVSNLGACPASQTVSDWFVSPGIYTAQQVTAFQNASPSETVTVSC